MQKPELYRWLEQSVWVFV